MIDSWLQTALGGMERLRWLVLRAFGVLPGDAAARNMTDADFVRCGLQMLIDQRRRSGAGTDEAGGNPGFEQEKFDALGGGV